MTPWELGAAALVTVLCILTRLRNWTVVALAASFLVVHGVWALTGICSAALDIMCDYAVIMAIFAKVDLGECSPVGGLWTNRAMCWAGVPMTDRIVLGIFPLCWVLMAWPMDDWTRYFMLWGCGVAQLLVASSESLIAWRRGRAAGAEAEPRGGMLRLALPFPRAVVS
jgi:hypothetical protein